jgi:hypothetical protein
MPNLTTLRAGNLLKKGYKSFPSRINIQGDSSFTAGGKTDLTNYNFVFIFCRPNLLLINKHNLLKFNIK